MMTRYTSWAQKEMLVTSLLLDPANPRLVPSPTPKTQLQLLSELIENDAVYDLAKEIAENGYIPLEALVVVKEGGRFVVIEGNRRLASMKALISPDSVPGSMKARFRRLSKLVELDDIAKVRVCIAPTRRDAAPLLMQKHTKATIRAWQPLMQARFYRSLVTDGVSVRDVIDTYGAEVGEFLRTDQVYELVCRLDLPEEVASKVRDPRKFPVTTLMRMLGMPNVRKYMGIEFDELGALKGHGDPAHFASLLGSIVTRLADGTIDSRAVNKVTDAMSQVRSIDVKPPAESRPFSAEDVVHAGGSDSRDKPAPQSVKPSRQRASSPSPSLKTKPPAVPKPPKSIIPPDAPIGVSDPRIREIFFELRKLPVAQYPNACAILFRTFLELSVGNYLRESDALKALLEKEKVKNNRKETWFPTLSQMLNLLKSNEPAIVKHPLARKQLEKFLSQQNHFLSVDSLDSYVHNPFAFPTPRELHAYWSLFQDVFAIILAETGAQ